MAILHPDTHKPVTVAHSTLPLNCQGKLTNIDGTPSDGYTASVIDTNGKQIGKGVNYMDGDGWYLSNK